MKEQVERLQSLSLSLLDLSQVDSGAVRIRFRQVDLGRSGALGRRRVRPRAVDHSLKIGLKTPGTGLVYVRRGAPGPGAAGASRQCRQVLGGRRRVDVTVAATAKRRRVTVSDTGEGIPQSELPRVFDRFYRGAMTRGTKSGTGLGLSIARDLTALMGGTITATSHVGQRLPLHHPPAAGRLAGRRRHARRRASGRRAGARRGLGAARSESSSD